MKRRTSLTGRAPRLLLTLLPSVPFIACAGCSKVQETGRSRVMLLSERQELQLGEQAYRAILSGERLCGDTQMNEALVRAGTRIAAAANRPDFDWEFHLLESRTANAFCLPGGKIAVYTGILPVMENEAALAVVLGHEVAHATLRHGGERISQRMTLEVVSKILSEGLGAMAPEYHDAAMQAFGYGTTYGVVLPYSRAHENEADQIGLMYAARAGYDPREAPLFWQRMAGDKKGKLPEFMSTHPSEKHRVRKLQQHMPEALQLCAAAPQQLGTGERLFMPPMTDLEATTAALEAKSRELEQETLRLEAESRRLEAESRRLEAESRRLQSADGADQPG